ncbi:MAG: nucleotidyl transferase AbiEii/AbiGii toxin family protein [Candidatus Thermoplasmatota archaeon]|nr:nucleotidyl transferase AbiEii/AbiGii toxin family protein [Candidatus Thermoplasmatota archaeon]
MFYLDLFSALARHRIDYVLIGGLAVSLHGIERATMDIDVTVAMTPENLTALVEMARELGMVPVLPVGLEVLADLEQLAQWHRERNLVAFALRAPGRSGVTLDVLLYPPVNFNSLLNHAVTFKAGDVPVVVASIDDLIDMKRAVGRPIDLADIEHLKRLKEY